MLCHVSGLDSYNVLLYCNYLQWKCNVLFTLVTLAVNMITKLFNTQNVLPT